MLTRMLDMVNCSAASYERMSPGWSIHGTTYPNISSSPSVYL
jgi:hypothetical protein